MNVQNTMTAKIIGEVIANGMSLCDVNLKNEVEIEAITIIEKIQKVISDKKLGEKKKIEKINEIFINEGILQKK